MSQASNSALAFQLQSQLAAGVDLATASQSTPTRAEIERVERVFSQLRADLDEALRRG